jgi:NADH-quinone oxidoreductase subunit I
MRLLWSTLRAMWMMIRQLFRRPITVQFPEVVRERPERYRSSFALLHDAQGEELCIGCLMCERICPSQVIAIKQAPKRESKVTGKKRGYAEDFTLDASACIFCELCVQVCPEDAIAMTKEQEVPAYTREDLVLTMAKLYENEGKKTRAWGIGSRLMAMHEPPKEEKKKVVAKPAAAAAPTPPASEVAK